MILLPSSEAMTSDQIDKAVAICRNLLEKHSGDFSADAVHRVLSRPEELTGKLIEIFDSDVRPFSDFVICRVQVDLTRTFKEALDATGFKQRADSRVVQGVSKINGDEFILEAEVVFFKPDLSRRNHCTRDWHLMAEFGRRGLDPAHPILVAAVNEASSDFAAQWPHATYWQDSMCDWCCAMFRQYGQNCEVRVKYESACTDGWWLAGVRKKPEILNA